MDLSALIQRAHNPQPSFQVGSDILQRAIEARNKEAEDHAVEAVKNLLGGFEATLKSAVFNLRYSRKIVRESEKHVAKLDAAIKFFGETGNPLPFFKAASMIKQAAEFCRSINIDMPDADDPAWNVTE